MKAAPLASKAAAAQVPGSGIAGNPALARRVALDCMRSTYMVTYIHMKTATIDRVRIFTSGNSQAIRLPKEFRLAGQTAKIKRKGNTLLITEEEDAWERFERGIAGLSGVMGSFQRKQPSKPDRRRSLFP